jgi:hypothetical protein
LKNILGKHIRVRKRWYCRIDIEKALAAKVMFNKTRPNRHGGKLA